MECTDETRPANNILESKTMLNTFKTAKLSTNEWCKACSTLYQDVCFLIPSRLDMKNVTFDKKFDKKEVTIQCKKLYTMLECTDLIKKNELIYDTINNIIIKIFDVFYSFFDCIKQRLFHHKDCVYDLKKMKVKYLGDEGHYDFLIFLFLQLIQTFYEIDYITSKVNLYPSIYFKNVYGDFGEQFKKTNKDLDLFVKKYFLQIFPTREFFEKKYFEVLIMPLGINEKNDMTETNKQIIKILTDYSFDVALKKIYEMNDSLFSLNRSKRTSYSLESSYMWETYYQKYLDKNKIKKKKKFIKRTPVIKPGKSPLKKMKNRSHRRYISEKLKKCSSNPKIYRK